MGEIARRFAFLVSAWVRLQVRLWRARFAPPPKNNAGGGYEYPQVEERGKETRPSSQLYLSGARRESDETFLLFLS